MNLENLINILRDTEHKNFLQKNLSSLIEDQDFLDTLDGNRLNYSANLSANANSQVHTLQQLPEIVEIIYFYVAYLNDRIKRISHFAEKEAELEKRIENAKEQLDSIDETAKLLSGATVLAEYAKSFGQESRQHESAASQHRNSLIGAIVFLAFLIAISLFMNIAEVPFLKNNLSADLQTNIAVASIAIKIGLIVAWTQVIRFIARDYHAEMHLKQVAVHRKNVLRSLHAVYNSIEDKDEKDKIVRIGAAVAYQQSETGYITTKEGAGTQSDPLMSLIEKIR